MNQAFAVSDIPMHQALAQETIYAITRLQPLLPFEGNYAEDDFAMQCADVSVQFLTRHGTWTNNIADAYVQRSPELVQPFSNCGEYQTSRVTAAIFDPQTPMPDYECIYLNKKAKFRGILRDRVGVAISSPDSSEVVGLQILSLSADATKTVLSSDLWRAKRWEGEETPAGEGPRRDIIAVRRVIAVEPYAAPH